MTTTYTGAEDAILGMLKTAWDAQTPALVGSVYTPTLVFEMLEEDLKPHPRDGNKAWARAVVRNNDAAKATLSNSTGLARYRRMGLAWIQVYIPGKLKAPAFTLIRQFAQVVQRVYEGQRSPDGNVVFVRTQVVDLPKDGDWLRKDIKAYFYFDEIH